MKKRKSNIAQMFVHPIEGLKTAFNSERNIKLHFVAAIVIIILGIVKKITFKEWMWLSISISLVVISELFNTAIEKICDFIEPNQNEGIKKIKDIAAAAVLIAACFALIAAVFVFVPFHKWI